MIVPDYFYTRKNAPGLKSFLLRWLGYKIRTGATWIAIYGQSLIHKGQVEVKHKMPNLKELWKK